MSSTRASSSKPRFKFPHDFLERKGLTFAGAHILAALLANLDPVSIKFWINRVHGFIKKITQC